MRIPHSSSESCRTINYNLGRIPQYIIYHFNKQPVRNHIIHQALKKHEKNHKFNYIGTINMKNSTNDNGIVLQPYYENKIWKQTFNIQNFENQLLNDFILENRQIFRAKPYTIFTVCYHYNVASVHFVAFIYNKKECTLTSFDPGVDVYPEGQTVIVPKIKEAFQHASLLKNNIDPVELGKFCYKHRYFFPNEPIGIQYNSQSKDAFCQTWTLYFLVKTIQDKKIVRKVCRLHPSEREIFLFRDFIIPTLTTNKSYCTSICNDCFLSEYEYHDPIYMYNQLIQYTVDCQPLICNNNIQNSQINKHKSQNQSRQTCVENTLIF